MSGDHNAHQKPVCAPTIPMHDLRFRYTPSGQTNVADTWRRFGWVPPAATNPDRYRQIRAELNAIA
jgi:hypothetical protein